MNRLARTLIILLAALASAGCLASPESDVYDFISGEILNSTGDVAIASMSDSRWFSENSVEDIVRSDLNPLGNQVPWLSSEHTALLRRLFQANKNDGVLDWSPSNIRVRVMSGSFRAKPRGDEVKTMCFSDEVGRPIGVSTDANGESRFRSYYSFSKVAFSGDGHFAMLKIAFACAPMSGAHESLLLLRKSERFWSIESGRRLWVS